MGTVKYTGPVASFHCPTNAEIRSLKVHFSPKQEGSGDPSPENIRPIVGWEGVTVEQRGKNLLENLEEGYFRTFIPKGTQIIASSDNPTNGTSNQVRYYRADKTEIDYWTLTEAYIDGRKKRTFSTIEDAYYWRYNNVTLNVQLEYGSTATPYEPYHGSTTNYEFGVLGKNKFPASDGTTSDIFLAANTTYTFSATSSSAGYFKGWYEDGTDTGAMWINGGSDGDRRWKSYTLTRNIVKGVFFLSGGMSECQIELGSTATVYEPYDPNKTVYGGWVDLASGEVCETHIREGLTSVNREALSAEYNTSQTVFFRCATQYIFDTTNGTNTGGITYLRSENLKYLNTNWGRGDTQDNLVNSLSQRYNSNQAVCLRMYNNVFDINADDTLQVKKEKINIWLSSNPIYICYKLATPLTYHLAPTQLQTFLSQNNVWSNADYVEVEYDLHETQTILARKQFIIANQPHVVKPVAAPLQNFTTDVPAPLKECKVHFSPVQDTSNGAPSPDNICPISGWTGVEVYRTGKNMLDTATSDEILEDWTLISPSYVKNIEKLPTDLDFTLQANVTKDLEENISNCRLYTYGALISGRFINTATPLGVHTVTNKPDASGILKISHNYIGLRPDRYGATFNNMQLELGSTATAYEPYSGTILPIDWTTEAGTVYGGYVDLTTGELYKTHSIAGSSIIADWMDKGTAVLFNSGKAIRCYCPNDCIKTNNWTVKCTHFRDVGPVGNWSMDAANKSGYAVEAQGNSILFIASDLEFTTKQEWMQWIINNNVQYAYPLNTPALVATLSPTTLKSLKGTNNIWSNANGNIELSYWKH